MSGWVPLHKGLARELPHNRPFTRLEAMFSLTLDYDQGKPVSVCGFSKLWRWSEGRVRRFLDEIGAHIEYPENTSNRQNQRGVIVIVIAEGSRSDSRGIKAIDSRWLNTTTEGRRRDSEVKAEGSRTSTIEPNPKPITSSSFSTFWNAYPRKVGKGSAEKVWKKIKPDDTLLAEILKALEWQTQLEDWRKDDGKYIPHPATWLNGRRWEDERPQTAKVIPMFQSEELNLIGEEIPA